MKLWAFKQVAMDGGRAFVITDGGRLLEGQLFSGQWRWTPVEITIADEALSK